MSLCLLHVFLFVYYSHGQRDTAKILLSHGAVCLLDRQGRSPLEMAVEVTIANNIANHILCLIHLEITHCFHPISSIRATSLYTVGVVSTNNSLLAL